MERNSKPRLSLLPGERRGARREATSDLRQACLKIEGAEPIPVTIQTVDLGSFTLLSTCALPALNCLVELEVERDGDILINGVWSLATSRTQGAETISIFEHPFASVLRECGRAVSPETFLRKSRYHILEVGRPEQLNEISNHYTEVKDFPIPPQVTLQIEENVFTGTFDFSSERRSLDLLEFQLVAPSDAFKQGQKARIEYTHFGVRYAFSSLVDSYDKDFGLLAVSSFSHLVAITARRFDRIRCELPVKVSIQGQTLEGYLSQISPMGGQLQIPSAEGCIPGQSEIEISVAPVEEKLRARVVRCEQSVVGICFSEDEVTRRGLQELFVVTLPSSIVARHKKLYPQFQALFKQVNYAPESNLELQCWEEETVAAWEYQDSVLPGNCTGGLDSTGTIVSSTGTLPFAENVAYGHSFCMIKTAEAATTFLEQALHSLAVADLIPGIRYYAGSYAKKSKFTTRLHVVFETHAPPDRQAIIHSEQLFPSDGSACSESSDLVLESVSDFAKVTMNPLMKEVALIFSKPHSLFKDRHSVGIHLAKYRGETEPCAVILKSEATRTFTAAGMYGFTWLFATRMDVDLNRLCAEARRHPLLFRSPFQVVSHDGGENAFEYVGPDHTKPAFWTITEKEDFGPVIASMHRAVFAIIRKYGELGLAEHLKVS